MGIMLIGALVGFLRFNRLKYIQLLIWVICCVSLLTEIISIALMKNVINTYAVFHIYAPISYSLIILVFARFYEQNRWFGKALKFSIWPIWVFAILNVIFLQSYQTANTNVTVPTSLIFVGLSIFSFVTILNQTKYERLLSSSFFWSLIGIVIYFSSSLLLFLYANWLKNVTPEESITIWVLSVFFNSIHYLCFNIALWMDPE